MNRFILSTDPAEAARMHCDKHVVKMIVEEAQMLSTVQREHGYVGHTLYRSTHKNHPCTVWAGQSTANYSWAFFLFVHLLREYTHRYGKTHASQQLIGALALAPWEVPAGPLTPFPQAMPEQYRRDDPVLAYREFYLGEKSRFATWTRRTPPSWWVSTGAAEPARRTAWPYPQLLLPLD